MNTSIENLTHKMQRAAVGKMVDVVLSHADKDRQKTMGQLVDVAKQFYGGAFSDETYEHAKQTLTDPDSKWSKLINCVLDQTDPNVARTMALNLGGFLPRHQDDPREPRQVPVQHPLADPVRPHQRLQHALRGLLGR